ncbi:MAG: cobyrinate a,c-diamide synthase [Desulfurivibrionaceae bacterium]
MNTNVSGAGLLVAGTHSDCGKTTITLGLMAALRARGLTVQPFKCGPDFIDPTLHQTVCGFISRNLDLNMCEAPYVRGLYRDKSVRADVSVVEGVMGLFDGDAASSAALARTLDVPVVLVVDARAMAESVAALVKGYTELDPACRFAGVILNRVGSARHEEILRKSIAEHCRVKVAGAVPRDLDFSLPGRHLGLHMAEDGVLDQDRIDSLARSIETNCSIDYLLEAGRGKKGGAEIPGPEKKTDVSGEQGKVRIGVARDKAFCFYYEDNLDIIRREGGEVVYFSPLQDKVLPPDLDGIYLGGGYPELYGRELAANQDMIYGIRQWSLDGRPLYSECGGFIYLTRGIDYGEEFYPLSAVFPVKAKLKKRLARLGYRQVSTTTSTIFGPPGTVLRGHEFHYSDIEEMPSDIKRAYLLSTGEKEGYMIRNTLGGYCHLHFGSTPRAARNWVEFCRENRKEQG